MDRKKKVETGIGPITDNIVNTILDGINDEKLSNRILDPITIIINRRLKPYIYIAAMLYAIIILMLILIIYLLIKKRHR